MKKRERGGSNGELTYTIKPRIESYAWGSRRKLEEVGQAMVSMTTREDLAHFLSNPKNVQGFSVLVEDIRYALVEYRVSTSKRLTLIISNIYLRLHYNEISTTKAANRS